MAAPHVSVLNIGYDRMHVKDSGYAAICRHGMPDQDDTDPGDRRIFIFLFMSCGKMTQIPIHLLIIF
jgi:hypothetical protein